MSRRLKYATFCSGIECMSVACDRFPLDPVFFSEIEPFPCAVLKARYPTIPNLGDMSKIRRDENGNITNGSTTIPFPDGGIDILAAGCPCQDYSVAGKRAGGAEGSGTRSSLIFEFIRIIGEFRPRYFIYENVPGMFTTHEGRDFAHVIMEMEQRGYSLAWRVLDAQYVRVDGMERAVPQRRRRVWVVGHSGADESRAAEILFEPDCVAGHTPPRRIAGQGFACSLGGRDSVDAGMVGGAPGTLRSGCKAGGAGSGCLNPGHPQTHRVYGADGVWPTLDAGAETSGQDQRSVCIALDGDKRKGFTIQMCDNGKHRRADRPNGGMYVTEADVNTTLSAQGPRDVTVVTHQHGVAYDMQAIGQYGNGEVASTVKSRDAKDATDIVVHCFENRIVHTVYKLDSVASNSMKSANPNSGIHKTEVAACLDTTPPDPTKNQSGNVTVSTNSNGENVAPTLTQDLARQTGNQLQNSGGYVVTRQEQLKAQSARN